MAEQTFFCVTNSSIAGSNMLTVSGSAIPELSGLTITEQANSSLLGQPAYLDSYVADGTFSQYISAENVEPDTTNLLVNAAQGDALTSPDTFPGKMVQLIKFKTWNQDGPYNDLCPIDPTTFTRSAVGCMATASASLLSHHRKISATVSFFPCPRPWASGANS
jgi:hypothetical protein